MIGRWIAYGLFLLGALLLQILYDGYLGGLLLPIAWRCQSSPCY